MIGNSNFQPEQLFKIHCTFNFHVILFLNLISFYVMFYLVLNYTSVKLTFIAQKYVIFLLAVLGHHNRENHKFNHTLSPGNLK